MAKKTLQANEENVINHVRGFISTTEDLLSAAGKESGEKLRKIHQRATENLKTAKAHLVTAEKFMVNQANEAAYATDKYVRENPWRAVGIASAVGLLLGLLISRR